MHLVMGITGKVGGATARHLLNQRLLRRDRTILPQSCNLMQWQRMLFRNSFCMLRNPLIWSSISSYFFRARLGQRAEAGVFSRKP